MRLAIPFHPGRISRLLGSVAVFLAILSIFARYIEESLGGDTSNLIANLIRVLNINRESSIPTWYSSALLLGCAALLGVITLAKSANREPYVRHWAGLVVLFLYLSIDEAAAIHESFTDPLQTALNVTHYLYFAWVIAAVPLVILFGLVYLKFLIHLPRRIRVLFVVAGITYVGGALVIESISANQWYMDSGSSLLYSAVGTLEELCEMLGVIILIYTLLTYIMERDYTVLMHPSNIRESAITDVDTLPAHNKPTRVFMVGRRWVISGAVVIASLNVALLMWMSGHPPIVEASQSSADAVLNMIDEVAADGVLVTRLTGKFGVDHTTSLKVANSLLGLFDEVVVVTPGSLGTSVVFAADKLPFDRESLAEMLRTNGETQFIIFDTLAVQAIAGGVPVLEG